MLDINKFETLSLKETFDYLNNYKKSELTVLAKALGLNSRCYKTKETIIDNLLQLKKSQQSGTAFNNMMKE